MVNGPRTRPGRDSAGLAARHEENVRRLRRRIFTAARTGTWRRSGRCRRRMLRSRQNALVSVRRVAERQRWPQRRRGRRGSRARRPGQDGAGRRAAPRHRPGGPCRSSGCTYRRQRAAGGARSAFPRRRHSAALSSDPSGFVIVTHPFHPLNGQRLEILVCQAPRGGHGIRVRGRVQRSDDAAGVVDRPGRAARDWPAVGRGARRTRRGDTRTAGSLIVMPGSGILFCDERAKERDRGRPAGTADAAAAVEAARPGRAARRRRAGAIRLADRADAAMPASPAAAVPGQPHGPYAFFVAEDRRAGPAGGTSRRPWPRWRAGTCATARRSSSPLAEISAINAELLARRELP